MHDADPPPPDRCPDRCPDHCPDRCFVCDREETPLLRLCACRLAHPACKTAYRRLHRGSVHEVFCPDCRSLHHTLPTHLATDAALGRHHAALVSLRLPGSRRPLQCAILSSAEGREQLRALARAHTAWPGPWKLSALCQVGSSPHFAQIDGWEAWPWLVYSIAATQARHGLGRHWLELVRDTTITFSVQ